MVASCLVGGCSGVEAPVEEGRDDSSNEDRAVSVVLAIEGESARPPFINWEEEDPGAIVVCRKEWEEFDCLIRPFGCSVSAEYQEEQDMLNQLFLIFVHLARTSRYRLTFQIQLPLSSPKLPPHTESTRDKRDIGYIMYSQLY